MFNLKNLFKKIASVTLSALICLSSGLLAANAAEDEAVEIKTTTINHQSVMYEPSERENLATNDIQKYLGSVSSASSPDVVFTSKTLMMGFTDLDRIEIKEFTDNKDGKDVSVKQAYEYGVGLYTTMDFTKQVWKSPKYIHPSTSEWAIKKMNLFTNGKKIYAVCLETKVVKDEAITLYPATQIAVHEYSEELGTFSPIKLIPAAEGKIYINPELVFETVGPCLTWAEYNVTDKKISFCYARKADNNWSQVKTVPDTAISGSTNSTEPFVVGLINGKLAFAYAEKGTDNKTTLFIKSYTGSVALKRETDVENVFFGKLNTNTKPCFYYVTDDRVYNVDVNEVDGVNQVSRTIVIEKFEDANHIEVTSDGDLFYTPKANDKRVSQLSYNKTTKKYETVKKAAILNSEISEFSVADLGDENIIFMVAESSDKEQSKLNEKESNLCHSNLYYVRYLESNTPVKEETNDKVNDEKVDLGTPETDKDHVTVRVNYEMDGKTGYIIIRSETDLTEKELCNKTKKVLGLGEDDLCDVVSGTKFPLKKLDEGVHDVTVEITRADQQEVEDKADNNVEIPDTGSTGISFVALTAFTFSTGTIMFLRKKKERDI